MIVIEVELLLARLLRLLQNETNHDSVLNCALLWLDEVIKKHRLEQPVLLYPTLRWDGFLRPGTLCLSPGFSIFRLIHPLECAAVRVFNGLGVNESTHVVSGN